MAKTVKKGEHWLFLLLIACIGRLFKKQLPPRDISQDYDKLQMQSLNLALQLMRIA